MTNSSTADLLSALRTVHDRLTDAFSELGDERATLQSYDDDWSVAQVASHVGSSAEIFHPYVEAGATGQPAPGGERNQAIWDVWNAKAPTDQIRDSLAANIAFLDAVEALSEQERAEWRLSVFGMDQDLPAFLRMRLNEYAVHTWDVSVVLDPSSTVLAQAVPYLVDNLAMVAGWGGKPVEQQTSVEVRTTDPERAFHLDLGPAGVSLSPSLDDTASATLELPAEAFVRLVYGRLDPDHTPASVVATGVDLDLLRTAFPGL